MDWIYIAVMTLLIGGFVVGVFCLGHRYGKEAEAAGYVKLQRPPVRVSSQGNKSSLPVSDAMRHVFPICPECHVQNGHHPDCPRNAKAPTAQRRRGFSAIKRNLESQESNNASN